MDEKTHTREHTFPAVVQLLGDGRWHDRLVVVPRWDSGGGRADLSAVTTFPNEWLEELEREGFALEREGERVRLVA